MRRQEFLCRREVAGGIDDEDDDEIIEVAEGITSISGIGGSERTRPSTSSPRADWEPKRHVAFLSCAATTDDDLRAVAWFEVRGEGLFVDHLR
jgi:hypothetical protein